MKTLAFSVTFLSLLILSGCNSNLPQRHQEPRIASQSQSASETGGVPSAVAAAAKAKVTQIVGFFKKTFKPHEDPTPTPEPMTETLPTPTPAPSATPATAPGVAPAATVVEANSPPKKNQL